MKPYMGLLFLGRFPKVAGGIWSTLAGHAVGTGDGPTTDGSNIIAAGAAGAYGTDGPDTAVGA